MALRDLLVSFGVEVTGKEQIKDVDDKIVETIDHAKKLAQAFAGLAVVKAVAGFITDAIEMGAKVSDTANRIGVATNDLQAFQYAANMVGVSSEQAANALSQLERRAGTAADGGNALSKEFAKLGINVRDSATGGVKPAIDLLEQAAAKLATFNNEGQRLDYIQKLFGRTAQGLNALFRDPEALKKYIEEFKALGLGMRDDFIKEAKEADRGLTRLSWGFNVMKSRIVLGVLPALEKGMVLLGRFMGFMSRLADSTYGAQTALMALAAIAVGLFAPLLIEMAPVVALFGGLYLLFDDLYTLFHGGDTLIGRLIDSIFGVGTAAKTVEWTKGFFSELWDDLKGLAQAAVDLGPKLVDAFQQSKPVIEGVMRTLGAFLRLLGGAAQAAVRGAHGDWEGVGKAIDSAGNAVFGRDGLLGKYVTFDPTTNTRDYLPGGDLSTPGSIGIGPKSVIAPLPPPMIGPPAPPPRWWGGMVPPEVNVHNETHVVVQGATTNEETGRKVGEATTEAQDAATRDAYAGIAATLGGH